MKQAAKRRWLYVDNELRRLDEPNRSILRNLWATESDRFLTAKGSSVKHHAFIGGYVSHIYDVLWLARKLYQVLPATPFVYNDAVLVLFLHDLEKAWQYSLLDPIHLTKSQKEAWRSEKFKELGLQLSEEHFNGLRHCEIEKDYSPTERQQGPLAAFCHVCDTLSARMYWEGLEC